MVTFRHLFIFACVAMAIAITAQANTPLFVPVSPGHYSRLATTMNELFDPVSSVSVSASTNEATPASTIAIDLGDTAQLFTGAPVTATLMKAIPATIGDGVRVHQQRRATSAAAKTRDVDVGRRDQQVANLH